MRYRIVLESQEEGGFTATVPALPGCISEGETRREVLANIRDAINGWLRCYYSKIKREHPHAELLDISVRA